MVNHDTLLQKLDAYELLIIGFCSLSTKQKTVAKNCPDVTAYEIQQKWSEKNNSMWNPAGFHFRTAVVFNLC